MKFNSLRSLSSGILYAGAAIGVSHLVQSTRAGAAFGLELILAIILIHILKYSLFKAGAWYPARTGKDLIHGYKSLSNWAPWIFLLMTLATMSIIIAAICMVSAGLMANLISTKISVSLWSFILLLSSCLVIYKSNTDALSNYLKWRVLALSLTTIICLAANYKALYQLFTSFKGFTFSLDNRANFIFLLAFLGWMPAPMDISVWQSIWIVDGKKSQDSNTRMLDFKIGYWGTAIMAIIFVMLGASVFYNSEIVLQDGAVAFTAQFLNMYASTLGNWVYPIIAFAALATMLSTLITCLDAFPKALHSTLKTIEYKGPSMFKNQHFLLLFNAVISLIIILFFSHSLASLVDFATIISFVVSPVLGYFNYRLLFDKKPWGLEKIVSCLGLLLLTALAFAYLLV